MNKTILIGRLVKDPEVKTTASQVAVCSFTVAVDRKFKNKDGERDCDFISCIAWRQQAEFLGRYFSKGSRVCITGSLQARSYDNAEGKKVYVTEVVVEELEFVDSKKDATNERSSVAPSSGDPVKKYAAPEVGGGFYPAYDDSDPTQLPFDL